MTIREQVQEFHRLMNIDDPATPTIPDHNTVRLRVALVAEEFFEFLKAMGDNYWATQTKEAIKLQVGHILDRLTLPVDMVEAMDACQDLDYVVEGCRLAFGVNGEPLAAAVHAANVAKVGGPICPETGKRLKPAGWVPPDIAGCLRAQGWNPDHGTCQTDKTVIAEEGGAEP